ncbi:MAG: biopolymer transporter ExbD [Bdellovibrionales bacterium]|nr:biopolymer transporter ExbD [Bdellovibrionales bacterium]
MMNGTLRKRKPLESNFELQITALIDTLVIILLFMLKSISMESLEVEAGKGITMPTVMNGMTAGTGARLYVATDGVSWNSQKLVNWDSWGNAQKSPAQEWSDLGHAIAEQVKKEKDEKTFEGKLLLQADKDVPYPVLQQALRTARNHGYKDIRLVGAKLN